MRICQVRPLKACRWSKISSYINVPSRGLQTSRDRHASVHRSPSQGIIYCSDPSKVNTFTDFIEPLKTLQRPSGDPKRQGDHNGRYAMVMLATPKVAALVKNEPDSIGKVLQRAIGDALPSEVTDIDVIYGCVDGVPPTLERVAASRGRGVLEGLACLSGYASDILPNFKIERTLTIGPQAKPASITILGGEENALAVTLPLANTLFTTGWSSTLLASSWRFTNGGYVQTEPPVPISSISVNAFVHQSSKDVEIYVPALPLTPVRQIVEGYGNIVRAVDFGKEGALGASLELETKVPRFLEQVSTDPSIEIWALLIPQETLASSTAEKRSGFVGGKMTPQSLEAYKEIGYWISRGARLCRVQSGGGGWGAKAGLLSLEPETTYVKEAESANIDDFSFDEMTFQGLGDIAKAGQHIQYYTARRTRTANLANPVEHTSDKRGGLVTIVGTLPSSIDAIEQTAEQKQREELKMQISASVSSVLHDKALKLMNAPFPSNESVETGATIAETIAQSSEKSLGANESKEVERDDARTLHASSYISPGYFGLVSEGGMYVQQGESKTSPLVKTKISIPHSYLWKTTGQGQSDS